MPLSLVLRLGKVLAKKVEFAAAPWKRPPVHVDAVVKMPVGHPNNAKLTALTGMAGVWFCKAMMASTMLFVGSALPAAGTCEAVSGAVVPNALEIWERRPS